MSLSSLFNQCAVYWYVASTDRYGQPTFGDPVELAPPANGVRWEDQIEEFLDKEGNVQLSQAIVLCESELEVGGYLFFGDLADLSSADEGDPTVVVGAWPIKQLRRRTSVNAATTFYRYTL